VAYLLIHGELPSRAQLEAWNTRVMTHTYLHENLVEMMKTFRYDAHPMARSPDVSVSASMCLC
jgi:citrate synthase